VPDIRNFNEFLGLQLTYSQPRISIYSWHRMTVTWPNLNSNWTSSSPPLPGRAINIQGPLHGRDILTYVVRLFLSTHSSEYRIYTQNVRSN